MADNRDNPLLKALPPATDYISYLTILEYNLDVDQLPILHTLLQDTTLTAKIGWDLVHLLLPLVPASQQCLQDLARLGNPREVVLKVTELLESLGTDLEWEGDGEEEQSKEGIDGQIFDEAGGPDNVTVTKGNDGETFSKFQAQTRLENPPPDHLKFSTLLEMLAILHPRIKTKYPSRFLSTSLQAILPVYRQIASEPLATEAVLSFIKTLSGVGRPKLPPRKSSGAALLVEKAQIAPDPEGSDDVLAPDESKLQNRLLQSFLTYVMEDFMTSLPDGGPGLSWSSRLHERQYPSKLIPGKESYSELFADDEELHERDSVVGQMVALARDLQLAPDELLSVISGPEPEYRETEIEIETEEGSGLPSSASDVGLSRIGSVYLYGAQSAAFYLFDVPTKLPPIQPFPHFAAILNSCIGIASFDTIGVENETLIDTVLFLGFNALNVPGLSNINPPEDDNVFKNLLQRLSLLSANTPVAALRYNAHILTSNILHAHPSEPVRLSFIQDTLEHCPYENLKASAVGWLKDEILTANRAAQPPPSTTPPLFSSPSTLSALSPSLFPNPSILFNPQTPHQDSSLFQARHAFHLAVLNLYWLLLSSDPLFTSLDIQTLTQTNDLRATFLAPIIETIKLIQSQMDEDGTDTKAQDLKVRLELDLMEGVAIRVDIAMRETGL